MSRVARAPSPARVWHSRVQRAGRLPPALFLLLVTIASCGKQAASPVHPFPAEPFPANLSDWHLFNGHPPRLQPNSRVVPYDLNTPLFSDYASKYRFVWMPPNTTATYHEDTVFDFPVGTVLVKTFAFPVEGDASKERLIETRLLVHTKSGWTGLPYIWNDSQTEAHLDLVPDPVAIRYTDAAGAKHDFTYYIPNANECKQCHENNHAVLPIGPKARNLNKDFAYAEGPTNQLIYWTKSGSLQGAPAPDRAPKGATWNDAASATLDARARAYLDNNCAHCHQPGGTAGYTGVDLRVTTEGLRTFGVCKSPNSSGRIGTLTYDLIPGHPDESILLARMQSIRPKEMMPQIGRSVVHEEGVALVRAWIQSLPTKDAACSKPPAQTSPEARSRTPEAAPRKPGL
jgi:uncharacterized repeat protein (TIGR03806 family)